MPGCGTYGILDGPVARGNRYRWLRVNGLASGLRFESGAVLIAVGFAIVYVVVVIARVEVVVDGKDDCKQVGGRANDKVLLFSAGISIVVDKVEGMTGTVADDDDGCVTKADGCDTKAGG